MAKVNLDEIEISFKDEDDGDTKVITIKYDEQTKKKYYIDQTDFDILKLITEMQLQISLAEDKMLSEEETQARVLPHQIKLIELQLGEKLMNDARKYFQSKGDKLSVKFLMKAWETAYMDEKDKDLPKES